MDDSALLAAFASENSQDAFQELVRRHLAMVYAVCRRQLRDAHWAEDVTQAVFVLLARKAAELPPEVILGGWLYKTAVYACSNARQLKHTRAYHEKLVAPMNMTTGLDPVEQAEMQELLDEGLMELNKSQREVLILRFLEDKPVAEVARIRRQSLYATQKSLDAGLATLRRFLSQRGVAVSLAVITATLAAQAARAVPAGLAATVGSAALGPNPMLSLYVSDLVTHLAKHAARAKLLTALALVAVLALFATSLGLGFNLARAAYPLPTAGVVARLNPAQEARETLALWDTLHKADAALRTMDTPALGEVVAFTNPRQAENWQVMVRVFAADLALKQAASAKFGRDAQDLTSIRTFGQRLDEVIPLIDPESCLWTIRPTEASLRFEYRTDHTIGASLFFVKVDGQWRIDAGQSMDVVLEGLNANMARVAVQDLNDADQAVVLGKMDLLEQLLTRVAARIHDEQSYDLSQARGELQTADSQTQGRAFFRMALRFDSTGQFRN